MLAGLPESRPYCGGLATDRTGEGAGLPSDMPAHELTPVMPLRALTKKRRAIHCKATCWVRHIQSPNEISAHADALILVGGPSSHHGARGT